MKARGYSGEKASGMISISLVQANGDHFIYDLLIPSDLLWVAPTKWMALTK